MAQQQEPERAQPVQFMPVREQSQGAYSIQVPQGWQYTTTLHLYPDGNAVSVWQMRDPSGAVSIANNGVAYSFQEPPGTFSGQMQPGRFVLPYMPAQVFIQQGLLPQFAQLFPTMQVEQIMDQPDLLSCLARECSTLGIDPAQAQLSIASLQMTVMLQNQSFRQKLYVTSVHIPAMHIWNAGIAAQLSAPTAQFSQYEPVLHTVTESFHWNPQWVQMRNAQMQQQAAQYMQQAQMQALQIQRQSIQNIGNMAQNSFGRQSASQAQQFHAWDNIIAGNADYRGPGGQVYNASNDFRPRHWIDGMGQVHGGDWNTTPDPNWTPLEPTGN
ncbi:MAG TPA: hypothetical protein VIZ18_09265 [Ktedonobacteraceae bacterium]